jgi:carbon monoxide dehydrogenase subunit G
VEISQDHVLPAPLERVWEALMDFEVLERTLPGVDRLEPNGPDRCALEASVFLPTITGRYKGEVAVLESEPMQRYRLRGEAKGRLGWVRGDAEFRLDEQDGGGSTLVHMLMDFRTGGSLQSVGQRFMEATVKGMLRDFFTALGHELEPKPPDAEAAAPAGEQPTSEATRRGTSLFIGLKASLTQWLSGLSRRSRVKRWRARLAERRRQS